MLLFVAAALEDEDRKSESHPKLGPVESAGGDSADVEGQLAQVAEYAVALVLTGVKWDEGHQGVEAMMEGRWDHLQGRGESARGKGAAEMRRGPEEPKSTVPGRTGICSYLPCSMCPQPQLQGAWGVNCHCLRLRGLS